MVGTQNITCVPTRITGGVALMLDNVSLFFRMSVGAFLFKELPSTFSHSLRTVTALLRLCLFVTSNISRQPSAPLNWLLICGPFKYKPV